MTPPMSCRLQAAPPEDNWRTRSPPDLSGWCGLCANHADDPRIKRRCYAVSILMLCSRRVGLLLGLGGAVCGLVALANGLLLWRISYHFTNPPDYRHPGPLRPLPALDDGAMNQPDPLTEFGVDFQDVAFPAVDGTTLRGWYVPGEQSQLAIVAAHGRAADRRDLLRQLGVFRGLGASVLLFDYREHGQSDGSGRGMSAGYREAQDVSAATRYLKQERQARQVVVVGTSLGGVAAILAAVDDRAIDAVVAESAFSSAADYVFDSGAEGLASNRPAVGWLLKSPWWPGWVADITAWRQRVPELWAASDVIAHLSPRPILLIHDLDDRSVPLTQAERLYACANEPKELWLVAGAAHGGAFDREPDEYRRRLASFFDRHSLRP